MNAVLSDHEKRLQDAEDDRSAQEFVGYCVLCIILLFGLMLLCHFLT